MRQLPDASVDVAIADPPYNASKGGEWKWDRSTPLPGFGGEWSKVMAPWDDLPLAEYFRFTLAWLTELRRVVRPTGSLWIHGTYHNAGVINFALQCLRIEIINEVVWYKRNSFPNLSGRRLTASHETILWAHTGLAGHEQRGWPASPRTLADATSEDRSGEGVEETASPKGGPRSRRYYFDYAAAKAMDCPEDRLRDANKQMRTVWDIPNNKQRDEIRFGKHPTQKPLRLLTRMLRLSAPPGGLLLAPFAGCGSECVAAKRLGLRFLGFEKDPGYAEISEKRLSAVGNSEPEPVLRYSDDEAQEPVEPARAEDRTGGKTLRPAVAARRSRSAEDGRLRRAERIVPPLIKWTGSKRSQAPAISALMPDYRRYFEPFLGGGSLLFLAAVPGSIAGDVYEPLVRLWALVQTNPQTVADDYERKWRALQAELDAAADGGSRHAAGFPTAFYAARDRFNRGCDPLDLNFLLRTCVNGIVRFNADGHFNNSFHLSRRGMRPDRFRKILAAWHEAIQGVEFVCGDYARTVERAEAGDFVYLDPPYAGNRQRYTQDLDSDRFVCVLQRLAARGVRWAVSFDGRRGDGALAEGLPDGLYRRRLLLRSGHSAVGKVLNGPVETVEESLYLNY